MLVGHHVPIYNYRKKLKISTFLYQIIVSFHHQSTILSQIFRKGCLSTKPSYNKTLSDDPLLKTTAGLLLEQTCARFGDRAAVISKHQNRSISFAQVLEEADRLAASFRKIGLEKRDRIGIWIPNLLEWYITKMACARGGFIAAGLNPAAQPPEMEYYINKIGIKTIVCADTFKKQDYYEDLLKIEPSIGSTDAGKIKSEKIPSLKSVIQLTNTQKK